MSKMILIDTLALMENGQVVEFKSDQEMATRILRLMKDHTHCKPDISFTEYEPYQPINLKTGTIKANASRT